MFRRIKIHKRGNPEAHAQLRIIKYCNARGYVVGKIKVKGSMVHGRFIRDPYLFIGVPDLLIFTPMIYFCEVKAKGGVQSPDQKIFQGLCERARIPYILAHDIEDLERAGI